MIITGVLGSSTALNMKKCKSEPIPTGIMVMRASRKSNTFDTRVVFETYLRVVQAHQEKKGVFK
jgi:hypothetical protein